MFIWFRHVVVTMEVEWGERAGAPLWCCNAKCLLSLVERLRPGPAVQKTQLERLRMWTDSIRGGVRHGGVIGRGEKINKCNSARTKEPQTEKHKHREQIFKMESALSNWNQQQCVSPLCLVATSPPKQPNLYSSLNVWYTAGVQISFLSQFMSVVNVLFDE